ncbi:MAG: mannose-1-phosphate guanylyltransferase [Saprospiraceae bacterium]
MGGVGSRFWPASRESGPKQFLDILGVGKSLIRLTFERFLKLCPAENIFIVTNARYKALVKEHLPELTDNQILCEPSRNNTAPCVAYACFKLQALNPAANIVFAPSDHVILKEEEFLEKIRKAIAFAATNDALLTLGIEPTRPDTGYGYVHYSKEHKDGVHKVHKFTEKPNLETARNFLDSGEYLWNAGIFIWNVKSILKAFESNANDIFAILSKGAGLYNTPEEQAFIDEHYPGTPNISVDFAILEKSENVYTLPASIGWSDLGTWASLHAERPKDEAGNVLQATTVIAENVTNSLIRLPAGKLAVLKGLDDFIVVDEGDVLLVWPKSEEQGIKKIVSIIGKKEDGKFS